MDIAIDTRRIPPRIGLHRKAMLLLRKHLRDIRDHISHGMLSVVPEHRGDGSVWTNCTLRLHLRNGRRLVVTGDDRRVVPAMRRAVQRAADQVAGRPCAA